MANIRIMNNILNVNNNGTVYSIGSHIKKINLDGVDYNIGLDTTDATATPYNILSGKTAYANGQKITGTIPSQSSLTLRSSTLAQTISSGKYLEGAITIPAEPLLRAEKILVGASICGITGNLPGLVYITNHFGHLCTFGTYVGDDINDASNKTIYKNALYGFGHWYSDGYKSSILAPYNARLIYTPFGDIEVYIDGVRNTNTDTMIYYGQVLGVNVKNGDSGATFAFYPYY